jgi:hypothetical protein
MISSGLAWPTPVPLLSDLDSLGWSRILRENHPPPVDARVRDLQCLHDRRVDSGRLRVAVVDSYVETWESEWSYAGRLLSLSRALELAVSTVGDHALQVAKRISGAWEELTASRDREWMTTTDQRAWVIVLDTVSAIANEGVDDSVLPRALLRSAPLDAPLVYDAWCRLGSAQRSRGRSLDFEGSRRDLWISLIDRANRSDLEARAAVRELARADVDFLLSLHGA